MGGRPRFHVRIAQADYDAFKTLVGDDPEFPATYGEWYEDREKKLKDTIASGDTVQSVDVDPQKFADWCRRCRLDPGFYTLGAYAVAKAKLGHEP